MKTLEPDFDTKLLKFNFNLNSICKIISKLSIDRMLSVERTNPCTNSNSQVSRNLGGALV